MTRLRRRLRLLAALALLPIAVPLTATPVTAAGAFRDALLWSVNDPTVVAFAPNGRVFVSEKSGRILTATGLSDASLSLVADLSDDVYNYWDRGLLGLAVDPSFPSRPYIYALYAYDHILGGAGGTPRWGGTALSDGCPKPPGGNTDGCVVSGRLDRITIDTSDYTMGARKALITDWCQQFPSHSIGSLAFGPEGALYVSGGDGASFNEADFGQLTGYWSDPCGDPADEGGALRSQDLRTGGDPTSLDGTVIRVDPDTGDAWPTNANHGSGDANARRIIAYGLRNPFRMTVRPDGSVWVGDVGYETWEEIDKIPDPDAPPRNFGWPCFEGGAVQAKYAAYDLPICLGLGGQDGPQFAYDHSGAVIAGDGCAAEGSSAISGIAFRGTNGTYPDSYDHGLFFTDYGRKCIWFVPSSGGEPDFAGTQKFADLRSASGTAIYLGFSPGGDLVYTDLNRNEVRRISYDRAPRAAFTYTPQSGSSPLTVALDAGGSSDPDGDAIAYAWDLDGDGQYDDSTRTTASRRYTTKGAHSVGLRVTAGGQSDTVQHTAWVDLTPPVAHIDAPSKALRWAVGDEIGFSGHATDAEDGALPDSAFTWTLRMMHCPSDCHSHTIESWEDISSGSLFAPKHDYPSHLQLVLTVTDSDGQSGSASVDVHPRTGTVDAASDPGGIPLTVDSQGIGMVGGSLEVSAPATAKLGEDTFAWDRWSDGGDRAHAVTVGEGATHLKASYAHLSSSDAPSTCSGATTLPSSTWRFGRLGSRDVDWYRFSNSSTRTVQVILSDLPVDASLRLYRGCSTLVATSDRSGTRSEEIVARLSKGNYAIRIATHGGSSSDPYRFRIRRLSSGLSVMSATAHVDDGAGRLTLTGEVWNEYSTSRGPIKVTAALYDDGGHLLATRSANALLYATSRSRAPFRITGSLPDGFARVRYTVSAPVSNKTIRGVSSRGSSFAKVDGRWRATGTIKASKGSVRYLKMALTLYDGRGNVVDAVRGTVGKTTLANGTSTSYMAWSSFSDLDVDRAKVRTFGFRP